MPAIAATPNTRTAQGTGFTNYDDVLNANQSTAQGLGTAVGQGLQSQADAVNKNIADQSNQFQTGLTNANNQWNNVSAYATQLAQMANQGNYSGIANSTGTTGSSPTSQTAPTTDTGTSNTQTATDPTQNGSAFQAYQYTGPTGFANASNLTDQASNASAVGRQAGSVTGQEALLKQAVSGNNNYNQGDAAFDQALLQKYGQSQVNQGRNALSDVVTNANNAETNATTQAQNAASGVTAGKAALNSQINNAETNLNTIGTNQTNQNQQYASDLSAFATAMAPGGAGVASLTPQQQTDLQVIAQNPGQYIQGAGTTPIDTNNPSALKALASILSQPSAQSGGPTFTNDQYNAYNKLNAFEGNTNLTPANPSTYAATFNPAYSTALNPVTSTDAAAQSANQNGLNSVQNLIDTYTTKGMTQGFGNTLGAGSPAVSIVQGLGALQAGGNNPVITQAYNDFSKLAQSEQYGTAPPVNQTQLMSDLTNLQNYYQQQTQNTNNTINNGTMSVADYINSLLNPKAAPAAPVSTTNPTLRT